MSIKVDTSIYINEYGFAPRGSALWAFNIGVGHSWTTFIVPGIHKFSDAKKIALREAKSLGADQVVVAP